jgi:hypothetical protein
MKANKTLCIALAAGVAIAGFVGFLLATEKGKKLVGNWKSKGKDIGNKAGELISEVTDKFSPEAHANRKTESLAEEFR